MTEPTTLGMHKTRGTVFIIISALMFGSYGVWSRLLGPHFGVITQGWTRALIAIVIILPIVLWKREFVAIPRTDWKWMIIYLVFTSATQAPVYYAFNHMDIGTATLLFYVTVLLTMYIVGALFLGEKLHSVKVVAFILACAGLYTMFSFSLLHFTLLAALMAALNGLASGGELSFSKKLSDKYSTLYLTLLSWIAIVITNIPISLWLKEPAPLPVLSAPWFYMFAYALAGLLGFWLVIAGLKYAEASLGGLLGLLEIIFSIAFGIFLFHERLNSHIIFGGLLILTAAALPNIWDLWVHKRLKKLPYI